MSESSATAVYMIIAGLHWAIACWKASALLRSPTLPLGLQVATHTLGGVVYVVASPMGYRHLGEALGHPWLPTLPIYLGILLCFGTQHILTILWTSRSDRPQGLRDPIVAWAIAYGISIAVMVVEFVKADLDGPADPLKFNTEQTDESHVLIFLTVFLVMLACGTLTAGLRSRSARLDDEALTHSVRWFGVSHLVTFGYVVCSAPAVVASSMGYHQFDGIGVLGSAFGVVGSVLTCYGVSGAVVSTWLRERRDIAVLQPLWDLVVASVDKNLALGSKGQHPTGCGQPASPDSASSGSDSSKPSRLFNVRWTLTRRVIEILDGIRLLERSAMVRDLPAEAVKELHAEALQVPALRNQLDLGKKGLAPLDLQAAATAAVLRDAVARLKAAGPDHEDSALSTPAVRTFAPGKKTPAAEERPRLVRVARALHHPLVDTSLQIVGSVQDSEATPKAPAATR